MDVFVLWVLSVVFVVGRSLWLRWPIFAEVLLENHQVRVAIGIPPDSDDVIAGGDRHVQHGAMLVLAFESNRVVFVFAYPGMHSLDQLRGDSHPPAIRQNSEQPGKKDSRFEFKTQRKSNGPFAEA